MVERESDPAGSRGVKAVPRPGDAAGRTGSARRPIVSAIGAAFRLGERSVFPGFSWTFRRGEQWGILGANGSGKSLLADGIAGRLPLAAGLLRYHFRPPAGLTHEESIGHLSFEDRRADVREAVVQSRWNSLEEDGSVLVRDFLAYDHVMDVNPFEVRATDEPARRQFARSREEAVAWLRLAAFLGRTLISLSNGERQRVQLARALCHPLRMLVLDEPFTGLDTAARAELTELLDRLMEGGLPMLLVTTRVEDLPSRLSHLLWVENGRVAAMGSRARVKAQVATALRTTAPRRPKSDPTLPRGIRVPPPAGEPGSELVRMRGVTVAYGSHTILRDLSWEVRAGESWALLGPNGSGKTTLLSLILGDNPQVYRNEVSVLGRPRGSGESIWEIKRGLGWVSPELQTHFDDSLSCLDAVVSGFFDTVGVFEEPGSRRRTAARGWLERFSLSAVAHEPMSSLSAGGQRMVLLARALVKRPRLLILDEPCQGLDASHRAGFLAALDDLMAGDGVTAIYVTHRVEEIPRAIRRVLRLERGAATAGWLPPR